MADSKPKLAEARQQSQPGRSLSGVKTADLMKTDAMIKRFASYAPPGIDFRPLHASAALAVAQSADLQKAEPLMLVQTMMGLTRLGLEINSPLGHAYLIPFEMGGKITIQVVIGYRGYVELAHRSGSLISIGGDVATMDEFNAGLFKFQKGTEEFLRHTFLPTRREGEDEPAFGYAVAQLKDGYKFDVMPWSAIQRIKGGSQGFLYAKSKGEQSAAYRKNPWVAHEWQMGVKTVLRRQSKTLRLTAELALATALDEMGEERDIDFGSVVDIDPSQWRDLTDASERAEEGKAGEQHQVKTPEGDKPKSEPKKTEKASTTTKEQADRAATAAESENPAPRDEPNSEKETRAAADPKPQAQPQSPPPAQKPRTNGAGSPAGKSAADFWT